MTITYEYDISGNLICTSFYDSDGSVSSFYEYEYDEMGHETKRSFSFGVTILTEYDDMGNAIAYYNVKDGEARCTSTLAYEFDELGNIAKKTKYNADGTFNSYYLYEYDSDSNIISEESHQGNIFNFKYCYEYGYEYDAGGNMIKQVDYGADGEQIYWFAYEYNSAGLVTKESYGEGESEATYIHECDYDDDERVIGEREYDSEGELISSYVYEYDRAGNLTHESGFYNYGDDTVDVRYGYAYEYDAAGNVSKMSCVSDEGTTEYSYLYEYYE